MHVDIAMPEDARNEHWNKRIFSRVLIDKLRDVWDEPELGYFVFPFGAEGELIERVDILKVERESGARKADLPISDGTDTIVVVARDLDHWLSVRGSLSRPASQTPGDRPFRHVLGTVR